MSVWIFFIAMGVSAFTGFVTGWKVDAWKNAAVNEAIVQAAQDAAAREREFTNFVSGRLESKLAKLRITNTTVNQEVRHEIEKPVYVDPKCIIPDTGVSLRNAAIDAANAAATSEPDAAVSAPAKDAGKDVAPK